MFKVDYEKLYYAYHYPKMLLEKYTEMNEHEVSETVLLFWMGDRKTTRLIKSLDRRNRREMRRSK